jgi:hypothetical protein
VPAFIAIPTSAWASAGAFALRLFLANQRQLGLGSCFGAEIINTRFVGDRGGGQRIVTGDHHGAQTHGA